MLKLWNSPLLRLRYDKLSAMFKTAFRNPCSLIPERGEWKQFADAYMSGRRFPQEAIAKTITFLSARCVLGPVALAILDAGAIETMAADAPNAAPPPGHSGGFPAPLRQLFRQTNTWPFRKPAYRLTPSKRLLNDAFGRLIGNNLPGPSFGNS